MAFFIAIGVSPESCAASSCHSDLAFYLEQLISFFLPFIGLTFLVPIGQLFCRMFLTLGLSNTSSLPGEVAQSCPSLCDPMDL